MAKVMGKKTVVIPAKHSAKPVSSKPTNPIELLARAGVVSFDSDSIDWVGRSGGGGRAASPENQAIRDKADGLKVGQGFVIPKAMVTIRPITNSKTGQTSTLYTYKGASLVHKLEGKKFRTKRDTNNNLYLFRVQPNVIMTQEEETDEE